MKYLKKILMTLLYPITFFIGSFLIQYIFILIFNQNEIKILKNKFPDLSNSQINEKLNSIITTSSYKNRMNEYLNSKILLIVIITLLIFLPILYRGYKKYRSIKTSSLSIKDYIFIILLGMSVCLIFNITFNELNNVIHFTNNYQISSNTIYLQIISSGIAGPILEELIFRGLVYNKLKEFNSPMKSIIIASIIFSLFHVPNILNMIYAFMMSFLFIYIYEKYHKLRYSILLHMVANTTIILFIYIITKQIFLINLLIWLIALITLIIIYIKIIKKDVYKYKNYS